MRVLLALMVGVLCGAGAAGGFTGALSRDLGTGPGGGGSPPL
jgi:hypothetical protein